MKLLSDLTLRALLRNPPPKRQDLTDGGAKGLTLRVGPGAFTWSLVLRVAGEAGQSDRGHQKMGHRYRISLGEYPVLSIEGARAKANEYINQAKRGASPVAELEAAATANGLTVEALANRFFEDYVVMKQLRAASRYEGAIRVHILPQIGTKLADLLSRQDVRTLLKSVATPSARGSDPKSRPRGGTEAARTVMAVLRKMIAWGCDEGLLKRHDNPVARMETNLPKKRRKDRVLSLEEARIVWEAAGELGYPFGPVYRLILLTGCRPGEWSSAKPSWIDFKQSIAVIPAESYKSDHVHVVPLVPQAVAILRDVLREQPTEADQFIFSGTDGRKPVFGWPKAQARMRRAIIAVSGNHTMVPWTPHDLRRTVATRIAEQLGVGGEQMIRRVLGHSDGSVTAIYNRYGYVKEMRQVLKAWADALAGSSVRKGRAVGQPKAGNGAFLSAHPAGDDVA